MRVLHLIKSLGRGGAEMLLQETLKQHDKSRFEFHYIYFLPWKNQMVEGITQAGGKVTNFSAKNNVAIMLQVRKIIKYARQHDISIIHCHLPWAGFVGRLIHRLTGILVVYSEHNIQDRYHRITGNINKFTFNWQNAVIAVSDDVAASIKKSINPIIPVHIVLNGVNTGHFIRNATLRCSKRSELGLPEDTILIGTIAVFRFQKRLVEWIDVLKSVVEKHPNVKGCIVGDGILKEEIISHVAQQDMEKHIIFPGLQTDVLPWMSAFDIYMMTSSFEGLPIALLEAMSMECAIVSTDAGGIKQVIRNGEDGMLCSVENWPMLQHDIDTLIGDKEKIRYFGSKARQRVEEAFSIKKMVHELEDLYTDILDKRK